MKVKVSEESGPVLDLMVAKCMDFDMEEVNTKTGCVYSLRYGVYRPTTDWSQGGPIIERELIELTVSGDSLDGMWVAKSPEWYAPAIGPTPLVAAMRCFVVSKLGDEVEVPDELCGGAT